MLTIQRLDETSVQSFILMMAPGLRRSLLERKDEPGQIVLGASFWGQPAGVTVIHIGNDGAQLTDLYVLPAYRQAGIATALLAAAEEEVPRAGVGKIQTHYRPNEHTPAFERVLAKGGWDPPRAEYWLFWTRCQCGFNPWLTRYHFRPPYELIPWREVTDGERQAIAQRGAAGWYPSNLNPFSRPVDAWDAETSLVLRYQGEIVGWSLAVREAPDQLQVVIMFVDPPLQRLGRAFMLAGEVFQRYCRGSSEADYCYCRVSAENEPMLRWARRSFEGRTVDEYAEWTSQKVLSS
ncbi:GNAT family N-acetyltransferase [bacterium]|nr:GNAT family N-acetyltransferase [bacterium]